MEQIELRRSNLELYLEAMGTDRTRVTTDFETLKYLSNKHPEVCFYQNFTLHFKVKPELSMKYDDLIDRLIVHKLGGFCYEHFLLLYYVLVDIGFKDVGLVDSQVILPSQSYDSRLFFTHGFLLVKVEDKEYFVDNGFGIRALRYPLPVDFSR